MKKIIIRVIGALCIVASLCVLFMTPWVQVDGIKNKDMRATKTQFTEELDAIQGVLTDAIRTNEDIKDELEDYDLPHTAGQIKRALRTTKEFLLETIDDEFSFKELLAVSVKLPQLITDTESVLEANQTCDLIFNTSKYYYAADIENLIDEVAAYKNYPYIVTGILVLIMVLGVVSAVTHLANKGRGVKYVYIAIVLLIICIICIAMPLAMNAVKDLIELPEVLEDMQLKTTLMPYVTLLLVVAPVVLDIIFEKKKVEV